MKINEEKLIEDVSQKTEHCIFEDSYGDGVCLIDGVSYRTYEELASAFGLNLADYEIS